jgi:hypothetical protein
MYLSRLTWSDGIRRLRPPRSSPSRRSRLAEQALARTWLQAVVALARAHPVGTANEFSRTAAMLDALATGRQNFLCGAALPWRELGCAALLIARVNAQQTAVRR